MDPNEALKSLREQMKPDPLVCEQSGTRIHEFERNGSCSYCNFNTEATLDTVRTLFQGLDEWLSRDGFLPTDWMAEEDKPKPARPYQKGDNCRLLGDFKIEHWDCDEHPADGTITRLGVVISTPEEQA